MARSDVPTPLDTPVAQHATACPVEDWLSFLGHRWSAMLLWHLQEGPRRPAALRLLLPGITDKVLNDRLAALQARGLVSRHSTGGFPHGVDYQLTLAGCALVPILDGLERWSRQNPHPNAPAGLPAWPPVAQAPDAD